MLRVTKKMRAYAEQQLSLKADASEDDVRNAITGAISKGELTIEKMAELSKEEKKEISDDLATLIQKQVTEGINAGLGELRKALNLDNPAPANSGEVDGEKSTETDSKAGSKAAAALVSGAANGTGSGTTSTEVRVKKVIEQFNDEKRFANYSMSENDKVVKAMGSREVRLGEAGKTGSRSIYAPSERQKAIAGAWFKWMIQPQVAHLPHRKYRMTELDKQLVEYALHECKFVGGYDVDQRGDAGYFYNGEKMLVEHRKAVLDEAAGSQGLEAVPIEFDDAVILTPLLSGELFPFVNIRQANTRRIEGFSIGNATLSWQAQEQTAAIPIFDTTAFIAAFDTNISVLNGSIEIGLDFAADSPVAIGELIIEGYGRRFLQVMDNAIASGTGTGQPRGIINTVGANTVNSAGGTAVAPVIGDYEALLFGVAKEYRQEAGPNLSVFLTNETTYARQRAIPVGASDARRLFGMNHEDYMTLSHPHKINETLGNSDAAFACLNRYRLYRRAGFGVRVVTEDADLARNNKELILIRSRWGGQMEQGAAVAVADDFQA